VPVTTYVNRHDLMVEVAKLYYLNGLSQRQIANRLKLTRSHVAYLLQEARESRVVEITINRPIARDDELERIFCQEFHLQEAYVVIAEGSDEADILHRIGVCGAEVLSRHVENGMVLGVTPGTGVSSVVNHLKAQRLPDVKVVQLTGSLGVSNKELDAAEQCSRIGRAFGARHYYLHVPLVVDSSAIASALRHDPSVGNVLKLAAQTQLALMGIGSIDPQASTQFHTGYLSFQDLRDLNKLGAVGGISTAFFDVNGQPVEAPWLTGRSIGVTWEQIMQFERVIGLAGGSAKGEAVLGIARSGLVDILVMDQQAAREALHLMGRSLAH
jgi:deoxyribonucleoside regulator